MDFFSTSSQHKNDDSHLIESLIDSDEDGAEIFDDEEEEEEEGVAVSALSTASVHSQHSRASYDVVGTILDDKNEEEGSNETDDKESGSESGEDYTDDEDEGEDGYKPGGYHPVKVGETYNQR